MSTSPTSRAPRHCSTPAGVAMSRSRGFWKTPAHADEKRKKAEDDRQAGIEYRAVRKREHPRRSRRPAPAGRDQAAPHRAAPVRDVLAAIEIRRVRRVGNVDVVA